MSKNQIKNRIKSQIIKRPITGDIHTDIPFALNNISNMNDSDLFNLRNYLKNKMPKVYEEMNNQTLYAPWIKSSREVLGVIDLKYNNELVGFMTYNITGNSIDNPNMLGVLIETIYVLKEYRGNQIAPKMLKDLFNMLIDNKKVMLIIGSPNYRLMKSLKKIGLVIETPVNSDLWMFIGGGMLFDIPDGTKAPIVQTVFFDSKSRRLIQPHKDGCKIGRVYDVDIFDPEYDGSEFDDNYYKKIGKQLDELANVYINYGVQKGYIK